MPQIAGKTESEQVERPVEYFEDAHAPIVDYVTSIFEAFKTSRRPWEDIWRECWLNFLGQYQHDKRWTTREGTTKRSRVFIKLTTLKCNTAHSKIMDAAFGKGSVPFECEPVNAIELGLEPNAAREISRKFKDRLDEHFKYIDLAEILDAAILECVVLGTGVLKGPIMETRRKQVAQPLTIAGIPASQLDAGINPYALRMVEERVPVVDAMPLWEYYVDANAKKPSESIGEIHFRRMLPAQFRRMAYQAAYNREAVLEAARRATLRDESDLRYEQLGDNYTGEQGEKDERVSVLEYWGLVPVQMLIDLGCELPEDVDPEDSIEAVIVIAADNVVIKACVNPLSRRPFYVCPYKKRPNIIYGMGVAEAMRDSQMMINSAARMMIDNKKLSGPGMTAINVDKLDKKRTKDFLVYGWKTWFIKGNAKPKDVIDSITFQDNTKGLLELIEMFIKFADEETSIPKYTHGTQDSFLNKTAAGMSMLMTQANINLKTVMRNIDNFWIEPIVETFHAWFMEMDEDQSIKIPLKIKALGTDSLMAKEVKIESVMRLMQVASNPQDAIFMDRPKLMKLVAEMLDLPEVMRSDDQINQILAEMARQANTPPNLREIVDIDKIFPLLSRNEQNQILEQLGIQPDPGGRPSVDNGEGAPSLGGAASPSPEPEMAGAV